MSLNYIADGQMTIFDAGLWYGKTSQEHLAVTTEKISEPSLRKRQGLSTKTPAFLRLVTENGRTQDASWEALTDQLTASHGEHTTLNTGEFPNEENESRLLQILEEQPPQKYYLSAKACKGILNRAESRGKELPEMLRAALISQTQSASKSEPENPAAAREARNYKQPQAVVCIQGNAIDRQPQNGPRGKGITQDVSFTLNTIDRHAVAYKETEHSATEGRCCNQIGDQTTIGALCARDYKGVGSQYVDEGKVIASRNNIVRRLTPKECERLQGFPDDWTNIGDWIDSKGKLHKGDSDGPRYKALGNSIALPFWEWMAARMAKHLPENATMASLFDGIGGFPLVYQRAGVKPVWASEIEEFPIAVTKIRFPEADE